MGRLKAVIAIAGGIVSGLVGGIGGMETAWAAQVSPTPAGDVPHNGTATGSAVTVLNDGTSVNGYRTDCHLQNTGVHVMYYKFQLPGAGITGTGLSIVPATSTDLQLQPGDSMYCNNGVTISSTGLSLLGTAGDTYALNEQFSRAQ